MKTVGIITIHKINNYGSVLQAYALQRICESFGYKVKIIDYNFPNDYHKENRYSTIEDKVASEPVWIKLLFSFALIKQHRNIRNFINRHQCLTAEQYSHPDELFNNPPAYDIYITGSDQVWNPRYCNGDPSFLLHFAPDNAKRISYAASIGTDHIPAELTDMFKALMDRYDAISVREESGKTMIADQFGIDVSTVLDPTLLLSSDEWNEIAVPERVIRNKYILCYFLNYSFDAFPYVDDFAEYIHKETGYDIVRVARPPHKLKFSHTHYCIDASPEEFLALVRDAEIVLTTSFHGTAFAVNYGKPVFTVVNAGFNNSDSRQSWLMKSLGLESQIVALNDPFPSTDRFYYNVVKAQEILANLKERSKSFLTTALKNV